ncbi:hypothetical protein [Halomonas sp. A11-A]|nr:hypothetical protein [Halomonas sp. A11-A]
MKVCEHGLTHAERPFRHDYRRGLGTIYSAFYRPGEGRVRYR